MQIINTLKTKLVDLLVVRFHVHFTAAARERRLAENPTRSARPLATRFAARARRVRQTFGLLPPTATARADPPRTTEVLRVEIRTTVSAEEIVALVVVKVT